MSWDHYPFLECMWGVVFDPGFISEWQRAGCGPKFLALCPCIPLQITDIASKLLCNQYSWKYKDYFNTSIKAKHFTENPHFIRGLSYIEEAVLDFLLNDLVEDSHSGYNVFSKETTFQRKISGDWFKMEDNKKIKPITRAVEIQESDKPKPIFNGSF